MLLRTLALFLVLLTMPVQLALAQLVPIPPLTGPVTDLVGILVPEVRGQLEQELWALRKEKGSEIAVLIVRSTRPEEIEQFSFRVADSWKLGRKGIDDGVLLLVAVTDRTVRIEVGRGLEGDIPDVKAFRIIEEIIIPRFKQGDLPGGIQAGVRALDGLIRGVDLPAPKRQRVDSNELSFALIVFGYLVGIVLQSSLGLLLGATIGSLATCVIGGFFFSTGWAVALGTLVWLLVVFLGGIRPGGGTTYGSSTSYGGNWGDSSSGGSFGGGESFGGGGSFSGGGASGRW